MDTSRYMGSAWNCLKYVRNHPLSPEDRCEMALELAGYMLSEAKRIQTYSEKKQQEELSRMMSDPIGRVFVTAMTDECFRSSDPYRTADQLIYLLEKYGIPKFFSPLKRMQLAAFKMTGRTLAPVLVPLVKYMLHLEAANVILPGEPKELAHHMKERRRQGVHINLNHLGEAILGEEEADRRLRVYLADLKNPEVECISVKISTLYSQINLLGWKESLAILSEKLKILYRVARDHYFVLPDGTKAQKFVNLDMEEYRDLYLTVELFRTVLDDAEFFNFSAGIVLQSYLPDSFLIQREISNWAARRYNNGGAPIKIRIVKGANLAMEKVEASIQGWEQAPYNTKEKVDANFKKMVHYALEPERARAVQIGIASHNLFDVAYALLLRAERRVEKYVCFEMLEGMADHQRRVVQILSGNMLLYCPAATKDEFQNAVAYLVRRLDENTAPENFLRHSFGMSPGTKEWFAQSSLFSRACHDMNSAETTPMRHQNRFKEPHHLAFDAPFANDPDTDWTLPQNRKWAETIVREWQGRQFDLLPLVLGKQTIKREENCGIGTDPSHPGKPLYRYTMAGEAELNLCLETAERGFISWSQRTLRHRALLLAEVAQVLRRARADLIGVMAADGGKTFVEADVEISEAIDFVEYYRRNNLELHFIDDIKWEGKGPVLVAPPWNFPCSIPIGGIVAALAAGNSVIFKPAPEAVLTGWRIANIFWDAGVDQEVLQFFCCPDEPIGSKLIQDPRVKVVILTGATATAKLFMKMRPGIDLMAETGGKNALIVTRMSDRDQAVKDIVRSAFGHAGQKCSACSLAILEKEVYEDESFRRQLADATRSLRIGIPWDLSTKVGPLIKEPGPDLLRGLTTLEDEEEWLVEPRQDPENPCLWSPGIKIGVEAGSFMHTTELFGPVLAVMKADNLHHAIELANATPYGLTSGLHSLDEREHKVWLDKIEAGNCYINRGITGAIVQRQPFGGCKASSFGPGVKAGGPNYVLNLMNAKQETLPIEREPVKDRVAPLHAAVQKRLDERYEIELWNASIGSYAFFWNHYFSRDHDPSKVRGQDNILRYVQRKGLLLRVNAGDSHLDILRAAAAALTCGTGLEISLEQEEKEELFAEEWIDRCSGIKLVVESEEEMKERLLKGAAERVRFLSDPESDMRRWLADHAINTTAAPVLANGRIELLHYLREVSISYDYHRYGYLGLREKN